VKVAIVHDWLMLVAGAEKVLLSLLDIYPQADLYAVLTGFSEEEQRRIFGREVKTSFIQKLPFSKKHYRSYLPLMPLAVEQFDLSEYDLVISSCYAVSKGVITGPDQVHISYTHSPMRYAWDMQNQYLRESNLDRGFKTVLIRVLLHYIRNWDSRTANGVDYFMANSDFIRRRILKCYRRDAKVVYPPVDIERFQLGQNRGDYYFTASRMVPYKQIPMIAEAFSRMPDKKLVIGGSGPQFDLVRAKAGPNITLLGELSNADMVSHMQSARAFVFAAEEDFGIMPLEAQACGTPVIAFGKGGSLETVRGEPGARRTGVFFREQTAEAIMQAVHEFEAIEDSISAHDCRAHAEMFAPARFCREFKAFVDDVMKRPSAVDRRVVARIG